MILRKHQPDVSWVRICGAQGSRDTPFYCFIVLLAQCSMSFDLQATDTKKNGCEGKPKVVR